GTQYGTFQKPVAVSYYKGDQICVLDKRSSSLSFFKPTDYGTSILAAVKAYNDGEYELSEEMWVRVLEMNSNMTQAYSGVGKSMLRAGEYKLAMENFKIAKNQEFYSKALEQYLSEMIGDKFTYIFLILVGLFLLAKIWKVIKRFRRFLREGVKKVV
ncbi:MAG: gluconolactonase, partial [Clostridiales bacterium]